MTRYTRRELLGAAAGGGAMVAVGCGGGDSHSGQETGTVGPAESATNQAPGTRPPTATETPPVGLGLIERVTGTWERARFRSATDVDWDGGIYFLDVVTREVEAWRRTDDPAGHGYQVVPGNRWMLTGDADSMWACDRETGHEYRWPREQLALLAASGDRVFFGLTRSQPGHPGAFTGRYLLADGGLRPGGEFDLADLVAPGFASAGAAFSTDATAIALGVRSGTPGPVATFMVDTATLSPRKIYEKPVRRGISTLTEPRIEPVGDHGFVFSFYEQPNYDADDGELPPEDGPPRAFLVRVRWDGTIVDEFGYQRGAEAYYSPDWSMLAYEDIERVRYPVSEDLSGERWPAVVVADAETKAPLFRLRSAALLYGDRLEGSRWLADGSGVVARVAEWQHVVQSANGGSPRELPRAPSARDDEWFLHPRNNAPVPNPAHPALLGYGRMALYDMGAGAWTELWLSSDGPTHAGPWNGRGDEMVSATGHGGHGGGDYDVMLPHRVEFPPFEAAMRFRVASAACLNLRARASLRAEVLECLAYGSTMELVEPEPPAEFDRNRYYEDPALAPPGHAVHYNWEDEVRYVYVRAPSGRQGWVAIQYLEWA